MSDKHWHSNRGNLPVRRCACGQLVFANDPHYETPPLTEADRILAQARVMDAQREAFNRLQPGRPSHD